MAKKIVIPSDIILQEFWKIPDLARAAVELFVMTADGKFTAPEKYFFEKKHSNLFTDEYILKYFTISVDPATLFTTVSRKVKKSSMVREELTDDLAIRILNHFNQTFGTKYRNPEAWVNGLEYWGRIYNEQEIMNAITKARNDNFWSDKMTPIILFRRKNPQGQEVDYIGGLLNKKVRFGNISDRIMG